jgi:hypothetical protein
LFDLREAFKGNQNAARSAQGGADPMIKRLSVTVVVLATVAFLSSNARADSVTWTDWTAFTAGTLSGTATGTISIGSGIGVSYAGQVLSNSNTNNTSGGISWGPASTFSGGTVGNPPPFRDIITLSGGTATGVNTATFSTPVVDPVMAIWSLGAVTSPATFVFTPSETFTIQSGGPSNEFGGSTITKAGDIVNGAEGNGTIRFSGTFSQITWTNPQFEFFYGFTLGAVGASTTAVPEPSTYVTLITGLLALAPFLRGKTARK